MTGPMLGTYLRRIRFARSVPALIALANEIATMFPADEATPRLLGVIQVKAKRLASVN